jgi:hypothetical protein
MEFPMTAIDRFKSYGRKPAGGPRQLVEVVPNDTVDIEAITQWLYVGGAGDLRVTAVEGNTVTLVNVFPGWHAIEVSRVHATGTTATNIVAGW